MVLREYVASAHGRAGSSAANKLANKGAVHMAGLRAGE
jgi:hypothetical protein